MKPYASDFKVLAHTCYAPSSTVFFAIIIKHENGVVSMIDNSSKNGHKR